MTTEPPPATRQADNGTALAQKVHAMLCEMLRDKPPSAANLAQALRLLAKWRAALVSHDLTGRLGPAVAHGPFRGMAYATHAAEGGHAPRLLGGYEASLHPVIETIIARAYPVVLDIGCAEGYYAVGLARRMPGTRILAHDTDPRARALCAALATANGVADRVRIGGAVDHAGFDLCLAQRTVVFCDIEGAEAALLDPAAAPGLAAADILVEVHEGPHPGLTDRLRDRFAASHDVTRIDRTLLPEVLPAHAEAWSDLDRLIALWEWRAAPTPWLWMQSRNPAPG